MFVTLLFLLPHCCTWRVLHTTAVGRQGQLAVAQEHVNISLVGVRKKERSSAGTSGLWEAYVYQRPQIGDESFWGKGGGKVRKGKEEGL